MKHINRTFGFSFIELLITLAVFSVFMAAVLGFFASQRDAYIDEDLRLERDQNLRMAADAISRELAGAGNRSAAYTFVSRLSDWVPSDYIPSYPLAVTLDANPKITLGDDDFPDVITFACAVTTDTNPTTLSGEASGSEITVSLSNTDSEKQFKAGDVVAVGYLPEYARVVAVDGNTLTIDGDPTAAGYQSFSRSLQSGSPLSEVSIVSYAVFNDENDPEYKRHDAGRPLLKRKINGAGFYPVAENISGMKVTEPEEGLIQVALTGEVHGAGAAGGYSGEAQAFCRVLLRNGVSAGFANDCIKPVAPSGLMAEEGLDESYPCRIMLSWDPVTTDILGNNLVAAGCPVTGYRIFFDTVSGVFGNYVDVTEADASGYELDVSGLPAAEYYLCVAAENSGGFGEKSPEVSVADTTPLEIPGGLSALVVGVNQILVSWEENTECDLAGYFLYRKKDTGSFSLLTGRLSSGSRYLDSGLSAGASYAYRVEAVDHGFHSGGVSDAVTVVMP
jgi:prepilin-type N-terminal cleavage/methylation domain-containing protein